MTLMSTGSKLIFLEKFDLNSFINGQYFENILSILFSFNTRNFQTRSLTL